ncbi:MAG TPA: alpha/beta fold hydrolase, partial [Longimicrobiales bacterium]|nr:alpha/beta fold hydrolase [Longimicrobiales bacterium]
MGAGPAVTGGAPVAGTMVGAGGSRLRTLAWIPPGDARGRVLLVHGFTEHAGRYDHVARYFASRDLAVLAYDQRGHGESEGRRGRLPSFELLLEDLHRARDEALAGLPGDGPPVLYGHSLGGLVVLRYLQNDPPTTPAAVLSAPWLGMAAEIPWWKRLAANLLLRWAPDATFASREVTARGLTRDEALQDAYVRDPLVHHRISARLFDEVETAQRRALEEGVDPAVPVLVLVPGDDPIVDSALT